MNVREMRKSELAGAFIVRDPEWREKIFFGGVLLLLLPPIGWPAALGYRKALISNLLSGHEPLLPEWRSNVPLFFVEGVKAMGVIFGYLFPLYLILFSFLLSNGVQPNEYWLYAGLLFAIFPIFSTLSFPVALSYWTFFSEGYRMPFEVSSLLLVAFALVIFFIPAGFLQVSKTGRYRSAFNIPAAFSTIIIHFRSYVLAWYHSALMSLVGHFALPFAPWGVVWCYLGIIFEFNSVLQNDSDRAATRSWFQRFRESDKLLLQPTGQFAMYQCSDAAGVSPCLFLKIGPIVVPLPNIIVRYVTKERS